MNLGFYLSQPFAYHALIAGTLISIGTGLLGPFVTMRGAAFFVHGTSELAFAGAAAGLLIGGQALTGALIGSIVIATVIGLLGDTARERDTVIGVVLAFGLGLGLLLLDYYRGDDSVVNDILFGDIFGVSAGQIAVLSGIIALILVATVTIYRPLLFASIDPEMAAARGIPTRWLGQIFLYLLAFAVTEAAQIVGTLLVLSLAITPAAAAGRLSKQPLVVTGLAVVISVISCDGGMVADFGFTTVQPSAMIVFFSFGFYLLARIFSFARPRVMLRTAT